MFGYIKPFTPELKVRELELYKSTYCGLCKTLRRRYGLFASFAVHYDMVFVAMLLSDPSPLHIDNGRCLVSPFKKKAYLSGTAGLDITADATILNVYWKLSDDLRDEGFVKKGISFLLSALFKPMYRKAVKNQPILSSEIETSFRLFSRLEKEKCQSLDRILDAMGRYAGAMAFGFGAEKERILYQQSRFITLMDAIDDYQDDHKKRRYNIITARYGKPDAAVIADIENYLSLLSNDQQSVFEKIEKTPFTGILQNIICYGNPILAKKLLEKMKEEGDLDE